MNTYQEAVEIIIAADATSRGELIKYLEPLRTVVRIARRYRKLMERECSEAMEGEELRRHEASVLRAQNKIKKLVHDLLLDGVFTSIEFNGDPRGYPVKFGLRTKRYNDWGGETWGVG